MAIIMLFIGGVIASHVFGLKLNETKTRMVAFGKRLAHQSKKLGKHIETFDFVGFTLLWGKSSSGKSRDKRKTSKKRLKRE